MIYTLALDPGIRTGYALFHKRELRQAGTWKADHEKELHQLIHSVQTTKEAAYHAEEGPGLTVVIEEPGTYGWHGRSTPGAQAKLQQRIGTYRGIAVELGAEVYLIPVQRWKGNQPKAETQRKVGLIYGPVLGVLMLHLDDNAFDAIGLGHWFVTQQALQAKIRRAT